MRVGRSAASVAVLLLIQRFLSGALDHDHDHDHGAAQGASASWLSSHLGAVGQVWGIAVVLPSLIRSRATGEWPSLHQHR